MLDAGAPRPDAVPDTPPGGLPLGTPEPDITDLADSVAPTGPDGTTDPWRLLRRQQDRRRYLRILTPPRVGKEKLKRPNPAVGVPRAAHHLLGSPATMTRTATNFPNPDHVRQYLKHSADLTMRGGLGAALVYPLASCALAEHYVFRRIAGSSAGAASAALTAAAELGRGAPDAGPSRSPLTVAPGFGGLAEAVGWLAGQDLAHQDPASLAARDVSDPDAPRWPEHYRLARLFQPSPGTRPLFRLLVAATRPLPFEPGSADAGSAAGSAEPGAGSAKARRDAPKARPRSRWVPLLAAVLGLLDGTARAVVTLLWAGGLLAWLGVVVALARTPGVGPLLTVVAGLALALTVALAALAGTVGVCAVATRGLVHGRAEREHFGLVPGVPPVPGDPTSARGPASASKGVAPQPFSRLDRLAGLPAPTGPVATGSGAAAAATVEDLPPLVTWIADRIDDLAGGPRTDADHEAHTDRYALTFGDLWLGRIGPRSPMDVDLLRRAADDPQLRAVDLALVTTNVSQGRPYTLPFVTAERAEREATSRYLFCRMCLTAVLPQRVVAQMILMSPAQATEATCPRHPGETLHEVPDPWDFPVVAAVRLSIATPGLLRAVPLYTLDLEAPGALHDEYGRMVSPAPAPSGVFAPRTQWFTDGDLTRGAPVHSFDELLPRWPTFGFDLDDVPTTPVENGSRLLAEWLTTPEQDAGHRMPSWRRIAGPPGFVRGLVAAALGWRDNLQVDLPGYRGRVAVVRRGPEESGRGLFLDQRSVLRLALRGFHAGEVLRERFTGPDGDVATQTQTDRYRWVRLRMALREYRRLSTDIGARLPLYSDLAASYRVPGVLTAWFTPPLAPGTTDPAWPDAAAAVTHLRALSAGGVLDWDTDYGAPPVDPDLPRSL